MGPLPFRKWKWVCLPGPFTKKQNNRKTFLTKINWCWKPSYKKTLHLHLLWNINVLRFTFSGKPRAAKFYLVFQQSLLPWMKPYNWVLTDLLQRAPSRTWKSMHLLQPDRALHHTVSRDDALVRMRTALSICGYNILLHHSLQRIC